MHCKAVAPDFKASFLHELTSKGRARLKLKVWVKQQGVTAFSYEGTYVALKNA